jgi:hypothetical protein
MMKLSHIALCLALLLTANAMAVAEARPSGHSGTSSSFKSGFSSRKASPPSPSRAQPSAAPKSGFGSFGSARPAAPAPSYAPTPSSNNVSPAPVRQPGFGSFGKTSGAANDAPGAPPKSRLSENLDRSASEKNALQTLDARKAQTAAAAAAATGAAAAAAHTAPAGATPYSQAPYSGQPPQAQYPQAPYPQPIVVQQQSSGLGHAMLGFMLGRAMSGGHGAGNGGNNGNNGYASHDTGAVQLDAPGAVATAAPASSFGASVLRTFLWLVILGTIGWGIYFVVRRLKRARQASAPNYTFER